MSNLLSLLLITYFQSTYHYGSWYILDLGEALVSVTVVCTVKSSTQINHQTLTQPSVNYTSWSWDWREEPPKHTTKRSYSTSLKIITKRGLWCRWVTGSMHLLQAKHKQSNIQCYLLLSVTILLLRPPKKIGGLPPKVSCSK